MTKLSFSIPGEPKGKARPRAVPSLTWEDGEPVAFVRMVTPKETRDEEARIRNIFRTKFPRHELWTGPVMVRFTAVFATPQSFNRALREAADRGQLYAMKKPDKDNIEKLVIDALNGLAYHDDQQVMGGGVKRYGSPARIDVTLESLARPDIPITPGERRTKKKLQAALPLENPNKGSGIDLSNHTPRGRKLIEAALARDEAAKRKRRGR